MLTAARLGKKPDIDVVLVGGSTYIPLVRRAVEQKFNWLSPQTNVLRYAPEKAVALGAAMFAAEPAPPVNVSFKQGYAVKTFSSANDRDMLSTIIPSEKDSLPVSTVSRFYTRFDRQTAVSFRVYEVPKARHRQLLELDGGKVLEYEISHSFGREVPEETALDLTTTLDENGNLILSVDDLGVSGNKTEKRFTITNISG